MRPVRGPSCGVSITALSDPTYARLPLWLYRNGRVPLGGLASPEQLPVANEPCQILALLFGHLCMDQYFLVGVHRGHSIEKVPNDFDRWHASRQSRCRALH